MDLQLLFSLLPATVYVSLIFLIYLCPCYNLDILAGAVTRIFNKFQKALTEDPDTLDIGQLEHQIDSIKSSNASYCKVHEEISDSYSDEVNAEEELFILEQHKEAVCKTLSLIKRLINVHTVYSVSMELQQQVEDLERKLEFEQAIKKVEEDYQKPQTTLRRSTIPHTHRIRQLVAELIPVCLISALHIVSLPHWTLAVQATSLSLCK